MNYGSINEARRNAQDTALAGRINDEARIANELQAQTGCLRTVALIYAKAALDNCRTHPLTATPVPRHIGRHGEWLQIKSTTDPRFIEYWSDHAQGRKRCDELNRNLIYPGYFIASQSAL